MWRMTGILRVSCVSFTCCASASATLGSAGFSDAKTLLGSNDMEQARGYTSRIIALTGEKALYWRNKALGKGLTHLRTGEPKYRTTSLLERFNREIQRTIGWVLCGQSTTC